MNQFDNNSENETELRVFPVFQKRPEDLSTRTCCVITHSKRVGLLPGDGRSPRRRPHLLRQGLRHGHQDEADVQEGDGRGQDHHQRVAVGLGQVGSDGRAGDQAGCEGSRYLREGEKVKRSCVLE